MRPDAPDLPALVAALVAHRLATADTVWRLPFADVRRLAAGCVRPRPEAPTRQDLRALMDAHPDTTEDPDDARSR